jgi:hypothetical protein
VGEWELQASVEGQPIPGRGRTVFEWLEGGAFLVQHADRAFAARAAAYPWAWTPQMVDEWCTDLRTVRRLRRSTLRSYQLTVRLFCAYLTDPAYDWSAAVTMAWTRQPGR